MHKYILFLDETKPNPAFMNFTLGGIIVEKYIYEAQIKPYIKLIKEDCFGKSDIILHEVDIRSRKKDFSTITNKDQEKFFSQMTNLFNKHLFKTIAVSVNINNLNDFYQEEYRNDVYYIALQMILENYTHFLLNHDGKGDIIIESTEKKHDQKLQNLFYILKANGTLFFRNSILQDKLKEIFFYPKIDNEAGLQIADFIPNPIGREMLEKKKRLLSIYKQIAENSYDGNVSNQNRFGIKKLC